MRRGKFQSLSAIILGTMTWVGPGNAGELFQPLVLNGHPVKWFPRGDGKVSLTFAVARGQMTIGNAVNCGRLRGPRALLEKSSIGYAQFHDALSAAFATWEQAADVTFVEIDDPARAQIVIGEQVEPDGYAFSNVTPGARERDGFHDIARSAVCLNPMRKWKLGFGGDTGVYDLKYTLTHEIGHAIGLDHPTGRGHMMSFRYSESLHGLSDGDIAGAEYMYGARGATMPARAKREHDRAPANTHASADR